jgi:hypothetical protein
MLFKELGVVLKCAPVLWYDNISALALASNPVFHARTKHIEVDYHFVREKVLNGDIVIKFISTNDQIADIFTKGLSTTQFHLLKSKLMVEPSPISLRGDVSDDSAAPITNHNKNIYDPTAQPNTTNHAISDCTAASETAKGKKTYSSNSHSSQRNRERKGDT